MDPISLYLDKVSEDTYGVSFGHAEDYLETPAGNLIRSGNQELIEALIADLQQFPDVERYGNQLIGEPINRFTFYSLLANEIDSWTHQVQEFPVGSFVEALRADQLTNISPGPEQVDQIYQWREIAEHLESVGITLDEIQYYVEDDQKLNQLAEIIYDDFSDFFPCQKTVFVNLLSLADSCIMSWSFLSHRVSPEGFAKALTQTADFLATRHSGEEEADKSWRDMYAEVLDAARCCEKFLKASSLQYTNILKEESVNHEYKVSFRTPFPRPPEEQIDDQHRKMYRIGKQIFTSKSQYQKFIETQSLKTIVAFLNTQGGTLVLGVHEKDNVKNVVGIEYEKFDSHDAYERHIIQQIMNRIGEKFVGDYVTTSIQRIAEKHICIVSVRPYFPKDQPPAFLDGEVIYRRTGPRSDKVPTGKAQVEFALERQKATDVQS